MRPLCRMPKGIIWRLLLQKDRKVAKNISGGRSTGPRKHAGLSPGVSGTHISIRSSSGGPPGAQQRACKIKRPNRTKGGGKTSSKSFEAPVFTDAEISGYRTGDKIAFVLVLSPSISPDRCKVAPV